MAERILAVGTLKKGFPLHRQGLLGARYLGDYRTSASYPMLIAGPWYAPMVLNEPGVGQQIRGELYEVEDSALLKLDRLESVGKPGNFREPVEVEPVAGGPRISAFIYMKSRELARPAHSAYLDVYDDRRFIPFDRRT
ncbi:MAG TPA: gamma-glutamylcyclotransferase family protein [Rhizobiaceae bacterium]|nr:gamma-glutamylcyclotransferase family protein [Rhizobiaceae bacterium]